MSYYQKEPKFSHQQTDRIGIALVNLGSPEQPTAQAVRPFLKQFLSDPRVVEIPRAIWWLILNGLILPTRPAKSAVKYAAIWTTDGSPLAVHTQRQTSLLKGRLHLEKLPQMPVIEYAMRYGEPSIANVLNKLRAAGCTKILVVPLYPQYAASTSASIIDEVARAQMRWRNQPEIRVVRSFADNYGYIGALAQSIHSRWVSERSRPDKIIFSFHGIPRASLTKGDPYYCECQQTGRLLAEALSLEKDQYLITFQSRFGKAEWLKPYTQPSIEELAKRGCQSLDVVCPGFVSDCLETLEEINIECRQAFLKAGGTRFRYIACLNENDAWIDALAKLSLSYMQDWMSATQPTTDEPSERSRRAQALGATQ